MKHKKRISPKQCGGNPYIFGGEWCEVSLVFIEVPLLPVLAQYHDVPIE